MISFKNTMDMYDRFIDRDYLSTQDLLALGFNKNDLTKMIENGKLKRPRRGYYEVGNVDGLFNYVKILFGKRFRNTERAIKGLNKCVRLAPENKSIQTRVFLNAIFEEKYDDVLDEIDRVQYKVVKGNNGLPCVDINGKLYTPQEISAMVLQKMKKTAEDYLGEEVTDAVITCPAYYGDDARTAVKNAGEIAGLNVRRIINEPTAAALSYGYNIDSDEEKIIVVADIGCGTADFTALEIGSGVVEVKSTNGDLHLGGVDFDNVIIDWVEEFKKDNGGVDLSKDNMAMQRLAEAAEKAKIELSSTLTTEINLPYITAIDGMPVHFVKTLTRANFENMTDSLVKRKI